jgi:hypothetical protein
VSLAFPVRTAEAEDAGARVPEVTPEPRPVGSLTFVQGL